MSDDEEEFRRALKKRGSPLKALARWAPMAVGGIAGALTFVLLDLYWPFASIPIVLWIGGPLLVGGGVVFGLQRVFGLDHP